MSDDIVQFVPSDPTFQPLKAGAECARQKLEAFAGGADEVTAEFFETTQFFHPHQNWSGVRRPACDADAEPWFGDAMEESWKQEFSTLAIRTPCCGLEVSLNELRYVWPAAFGKFCLEARNPRADISGEQEMQLAECLGCKIRKIWVHI